MKKYLVGGAVRNKLLNLPIREKDWVIVGATPQEMLKIGYEQVGKNFPVFLHPDNHEEYALARTEKKSGSGYTGFICNTSPLITIEEDLSRRDLTINAMAYDVINGKLIDPHHGQKDIKLKILRHISDAFKEDPLRVLRVARFAAQFKNMHFTIAPETLTIMQKMVHELLSLSPERIWIETKKALETDNPQIYFKILKKCNALKILFPELDILFNIPMLLKDNLNTKINVGDHIITALHKSSCLTKNLNVRFSILCHDIGKGTTPRNTWPRHPHHETLGVPLIENLCNRLKIPKKICNFSKKVSQYHGYLYDVKKISPEVFMILFKVFNCWKHPYIIKQIIDIINSNTAKHSNNTNHLNIKNHSLYTALKITTNVNVQNIIKDGFIGINIKKELYSRRLHALKLWKINTDTTKNIHHKKPIIY